MHGKNFLKNIFHPFVQADQGARSQYKGTGLGMAIVKELLGRMCGTIQIDSVENQGTTIHVSDREQNNRGIAEGKRTANYIKK